MAPGDLSPPDQRRFPLHRARGVAEYGESPWIENGRTRRSARSLGRRPVDRGRHHVLRVGVKVLAFQEDAGPSASEVWQLDAVAGEDGSGLPFAMWYEDGEGPDSGFPPKEDGSPGGNNDWTTPRPRSLVAAVLLHCQSYCASASTRPPHRSSHRLGARSKTRSKRKATDRSLIVGATDRSPYIIFRGLHRA